MTIEQKYENRKKSPVIFAFLGFFAGYLGLHRFYVQEDQAGIIFMALGFIGTALLVVGFTGPRGPGDVIAFVGFLILVVGWIWAVVNVCNCENHVAQYNESLFEKLQKSATLEESPDNKP